MDFFTLMFWIVAVVLFGLSLKKGKDVTLEAMRKSRGMMGGMLGEIVGVILLIGLVLALMPPETIRSVLGGENQVLATIAAALAGSVTLIPAFVAFPLVGSLMDKGASLMPAVAFLTTLTMVGVMTIPVEKRTFGMKFTLIRNGLSFVVALGIAVCMGVVLS